MLPEKRPLEDPDIIVSALQKAICDNDRVNNTEGINEKTAINTSIIFSPIFEDWKL